MEAEVGIEQALQPFLTPPKPFGSGYFYKCCIEKEFIKLR